MDRTLNRFELMSRFFDSPAHMAAFLGVTVACLYAWTTGRRAPSYAAVRLLDVMERLEGDPIHAALVDMARPAPKPVKPRPARVKGVNAWSRPEFTQEQKTVQRKGWDDRYWFDRTVSRAEWDEGASPLIVDGPAVLNRLTDEQELAYWAALSDYERRTGRVMPD